MDVEFDSAKDAANLRKHDVSLAAARELDWNSLFARTDDRRGGEGWQTRLNEALSEHVARQKRR